MSQGRLLPTTGVQLLLVALAIQGVTPDGHDLASNQALRVLAPVFNDENPPIGQDEWPDDVCDPLQFAISQVLTSQPNHELTSTTMLAMILGHVRARDLSTSAPAFAAA